MEPAELRMALFLIGLVTAVGITLFSVTAAIIGNYARRKGRTWVSFYFISMWSPIIAGTIVATMSEVPHPDEMVVCPKCSERIRHSASACPQCGQQLTPNSVIAEDLVLDSLDATKKLRMLAIILSAVGALAVILSLVQSDENLATNSTPVILAFVLLGLGVSFFLMKPTRQILATEIAAQLGFTGSLVPDADRARKMQRIILLALTGVLVLLILLVAVWVGDKLGAIIPLGGSPIPGGAVPTEIPGLPDGVVTE